MTPHAKLAATLFAFLALAIMPLRTPAQTIEEVTASPEGTATLFLRSVRSIRWSAATQFLHEETLDRFQLVVAMIADADTTGDMRSYLTDTDSLDYLQFTSSTVFDRAVGTMVDDLPGLMHSMFDRDDEVLGHVLESGDLAHVVYRTTARISGAVAEVKVMQLANTPRGWRVSKSDELEVLDVALRGVARGRRGPGMPTPDPRLP
ncbi:MAG: hypothetical protein O2992_09365 [Gemmatimonadetes bacterium]|nr:hypothetical protein [Gemmatimonadota bacterium]